MVPRKGLQLKPTRITKKLENIELSDKNLENGEYNKRIIYARIHKHWALPHTIG